jgi:hypothetical protein
MWFSAQLCQCVLEIPGQPVGERIVGHHAFHGRAMARHGGRGPGQEPGAGRAFLIRQDLGVCQAGVVIDGHVDVVKTDFLM